MNVSEYQYQTVYGSNGQEIARTYILGYSLTYHNGIAIEGDWTDWVTISVGRGITGQ